MAANDPLMSGLITKGKYGDGAAHNPLVSIARKAAGDMIRFAAEFGLTAAARARLGAAGWEPPSGPGKFDGLIG
jgi:phage terminase small subunit